MEDNEEEKYVVLSVYDLNERSILIRRTAYRKEHLELAKSIARYARDYENHLVYLQWWSTSLVKLKDVRVIEVTKFRTIEPKYSWSSQVRGALRQWGHPGGKGMATDWHWRFESIGNKLEIQQITQQDFY